MQRDLQKNTRTYGLTNYGEAVWFIFLPAGGAVELFPQRVKRLFLEALCFHHAEMALKMSKLAESNEKFKAANCC